MVYHLSKEVWHQDEIKINEYIKYFESNSDDNG